jgi:hypothetical protein
MISAASSIRKSRTPCATGDVTYVHPMTYIGPMYERVESRIIFRRLREGFITKIIEVFTNGT